MDFSQISFPPIASATPDGIVAVGGDLSAERLISAYIQGIFPWYSYGSPILWWSPDPRFVLYPDQVKVSSSMRTLFRKKRFSVTVDEDFPGVIRECRQIVRDGQMGTWITAEMEKAYNALHRLGFAHSVEVWDSGKMVGGLYGLGLGKIFFGESMFARVSNASKFGFITLVRLLQEMGFFLIDCQQETTHLGSLGAVAIPRERFLEYLGQNAPYDSCRGSWRQFAPNGC